MTAVAPQGAGRGPGPASRPSPRPASAPPVRRDDRRLLRVDPATSRLSASPVRALAEQLAPGDLVVVNDAATLPASLAGRDERGAPVEVRLRRPRGGATWEVVVFGAGDHRTRTERRARPTLARGAALVFGGGALRATVARAGSARSPTHDVRFDRAGADLVLALHRVGKPVQYAHVPGELAMWDVQTAYAGRPWASEAPSAGRPLSVAVLLALRARGVGLAALTHGAGLSSVGDAAADASPPPPERTWLPARTIDAIGAARAAGGRVIAVGTTVARALEGALAERGALLPGEWETGFVLGPATRPRVVAGLLSGLHDPGTSHRALLAAFAPEALLERAWAHAGELGLESHELGDLMLILPRR